jgi:hypothetical protein
MRKLSRGPRPSIPDQEIELMTHTYLPVDG